MNILRNLLLISGLAAVGAVPVMGQVHKYSSPGTVGTVTMSRMTSGAQYALATHVIVDIVAGANPATVAAKYGILTVQVITAVANAFTADVTARQITLLEADVDVQQFAADGIAGRIPRP